MNLLLDTNILISVVRSKDYQGIVQFLNPQRRLVFLSVASEAEIKSIAARNRWGAGRLEKLDNFLEEVLIVDINQSYINNYIEIDSYSQRLNPNFTTYPFRTPRNMGKNDLWIAALASLMGLKLITMDGDFDHLDGAFFELRKITAKELQQFLL